ncbi:MAG TPA: (4Fe-4S)-binding protein [Clostridiales bacterium]|nr:(4Fe-4S)-binding protein [Clostridiales bacterium]
MKQIVFISGKGGTGKSTLVACLSQLVSNKMLADCDVDAPDLHLLLKGTSLAKEDFFGAETAKIDADHCTHCGLCREVCRFDAITQELKINAMKCEGCGACRLVCPVEAITLNIVKTGELYVDQTNQGGFSHALLDVGAEGSGKLVTAVRANLKKYMAGEEWALIDGSPGIGCVVIASITGADAVVVVTEPTLTGSKDLQRVLDVALHFQVPAYVCINKDGLNPEITDQIERYCTTNGIPVIGRIPFDPRIPQMLQKFKTPVEAGMDHIKTAVMELWNTALYELEAGNSR